MVENNRQKTNEVALPPSRWKRGGWLVVEVLLFVVLMFALTGLLYAMAGFIDVALGTHLNLNEVEDINSLAAILVEAVMVIACLTAIGVVRRLSRVVFPQTRFLVGFALRKHWREFLAGIGVAAGLYGIGFLVTMLLGEIRIADVCCHAGMLGRTWGLFFLVALFEESACRGFLLGRMMDAGMNKFVALVLSSAVFSILHLGNPNFAVLPFINLLLAGMLLGSAYIYTRNLWFAIALHWFWNWLQGPVLGFEVSGNRFRESLLTLEASDNVLLNGGSFGFEGSLVCTVLMLFSAFLIIRYYERRKQGFDKAKEGLCGAKEGF